MQSLAFTILLEWLALNCGPAVDVSGSLGSPRFKVRQQTAKALEAAWPFSDAALRRTAQQSSDIEASEKAQSILERCWKHCVDNDAAGPTSPCGIRNGKAGTAAASPL